MVHDFNGHEVNGKHGFNGKKCCDKALYLVNNTHDFKGNFPYDDFFRKTHARLYYFLLFLPVTLLSLSQTLEGLFERTQRPSRALDSPCALLPELQRNKDTVRCAALVDADVPEHVKSS